MFYLYQLPIPRILPTDEIFKLITNKAALLICTSLEFDELAKEAGLKGYEEAVTNPEERAQLRAEMDAIVAKLYGMTEEELEYILSTFPIVKEEQKKRVMEEFGRL